MNKTLLFIYYTVLALILVINLIIAIWHYYKLKKSEKRLKEIEEKFFKNLKDEV